MSQPSPDSPASGPAASPQREPLKMLLGGAMRDFWRCLPDLFFFDVTAKLVGFLLLAPPLAWLIQRFVDSSGAEAVGNFDIAAFLLTPLGAAIMLGLVALAGAVSLWELSGLVLIGSGALVDRRVTWLEAVRWTAARGLRLAVACLLLMVLVALTLLPFVLAAWLTASLSLGEYDINYYLTQQPPEFTRAVWIGVVIVALAAVALAVVLVPLVFVFPEVLLDDSRATTAFRRSWVLGRGRWRRIVIALLGTYLAWTLVSLLANGLLHFVFTLLIRSVAGNLTLLLPVMATAVTVASVLNGLLFFAGVSVMCLVVCRLYREACAAQGRVPAVFDDRFVPLARRPQWSVPRKAPLLALLVMFALGAVSVWSVVHSTRLEDHVGITAHRAGAIAAPENSLSAAEQAIEDGATHIEVDVQLTRDGEIVVVHDADLMRLADSPLVVAQSTYEELQAIDMGSRFDPQFAGEKIVTLREMLDVIDGRAVLIIELKVYAGEGEQLVQEVVRTVQEGDLYDKAVIMSLHLGEVQQVRRLDPRITVGFVVANALGNLTRLDVDFLAVKTTLATHSLIAEAHAAEKDVFVWTVNEPGQMAAMVDRGVDNIITDDPATLAALLRERAELTPAQRILLRFRSFYDDSY